MLRELLCTLGFDVCHSTTISAPPVYQVLLFSALVLVICLIAERRQSNGK